MKSLIVALAAASLGAVSPLALAHGDTKPMHGGIVQVVADMHYELVPLKDGAALFVIDHGKPVDATKMSGKLTVLNGTRKSEAELRPAGGNKLEAGSVTLAPGAKVVASLRAADGKAKTVRFTVN